MKIKVYSGCAVDGHNRIYTPMVFAQRYPANVSPDDLPVLLAGPDHGDYADVSADDFIVNNGNMVFEYNESGDVLTFELIDSDTIKISELEKISVNPLESTGKINVFECPYGSAYFLQAGENCFFRAHFSNVGLIGADCFFEFYDFDYTDRQLEAFCEELEEVLKSEFEEDYDIFILPEHFASALINADESGLTEEERQLLDEFAKENCKDICVGCSEESFFTANHDLLGIGAANCLEFYFRKANHE